MTSASKNQLGIRHARTQDPVEVDRLYDICLLTGANGAGAEDRHTDPRLLGEVHLGAYLAHEPDLAFVLEDNAGSLLGYVLGARDTQSFRKLLEEQWWPPLREKYPLGIFPAESHDERLVRRMHSPSRTDPAVIERFPAHLHVNILREGHGGGNGRRLMETLFSALQDGGVEGVHLNVSSDNIHATGFYRHIGFTPLGGTVWGLRL